MEKTLVTKLNGIVDNNSLERLGQFRITIKAGGNLPYGVYMPLTTGGGARVYIEGDGKFTYASNGTDAGKTGSFNGTLLCSVPSDEDSYDVYVKDKYYIQSISSLPKGATFDVSVLSKCKNLVSLNLQSTKAYGYLETLAECPITNFNLAEAKKINSTIEALGIFTKLETLTVGSNGGLSGSVEGLIQNFIKYGRTSGSIVLKNCKGSYVIYYKGKTLNANSEINDSTTFTWDSSANISVS